MLCILKTAALDPFGMGIEMEGGKPGWYDALNGLPGLFGSSMAETYELARSLEFLSSAFRKYQGEISIPWELFDLAKGIQEAIKTHKSCWKHDQQILCYWSEVNDRKEKYWQQVEEGFTGDNRQLSAKEAVSLIKSYQEIVSRGIEKAGSYGGSTSPTYFSYEVRDYRKVDGIIPTDFELTVLPPFLEGTVHKMKLAGSKEERLKIYHNIKKSSLYDPKLRMYRVNGSLDKASFEVGRAKAFTPGWLENGSIWLHMEYKYLLELLKGGLYEQFADDFYQAGVPFLYEGVYGRSLVENSSFIASSLHPDSRIHGKGFVARLSGSTAEFLQMWQIMMFGRRPFRERDGEIRLVMAPMIPNYLIGRDQKVAARFLGQTEVIYHLVSRHSVIPGKDRPSYYRIGWKDGSEEITPVIRGEKAEAVRAGKAAVINVYFQEQKGE